MCIKQLNNTDIMSELLKNIGEKHVQYAHRGFKPIFWNIFLVNYYVDLEKPIISGQGSEFRLPPPSTLETRPPKLC